jgi:iron complex outermembrane receptor protein
MNNELYADVDGTAQKRFHLYQDQAQKQGSYETQLVSNRKGPLSWTAGLFLFKEKNRQPTRQDNFVTGGLNTVAQTTDAAALYGQADWRFNPVWKATAGLRYSHESKDFSIAALKANGMPNFDSDQEILEPLRLEAGVDAQINPDWLLYASATTGFKSGGFQRARHRLAAAALLTLEPETLLTYEAGFKATLLGGMLRLNANYFTTTTATCSSRPSTTWCFGLFNAASAKIQGVEIESNLQIIKAWQAA